MQVYSALHADTGEMFAVKVLPFGSSSDVRTLKAEVDVMIPLDHPVLDTRACAPTVLF